MNKRLILCGYFSLKYRTCTVGDLMVLHSLEKWLDSLGYSYDVVADPMLKCKNTIREEAIDIKKYYAMIFVCGPLFDIDSLYEYIRKYDGLKRIAVNVSVINEEAKILNLFEYIFPRDSLNYVSLDMALEEITVTRTSVVGLIYVGSQIEYPNQMHSKVEQIVDTVLSELGYAKIKIDTKIPYNDYGLNSLTEIISVISKTDIVITTRLHGSILAFKAHIPFVAIDPVPKGGKVYKQVNEIGWPYVLNMENLNNYNLKHFLSCALDPSTQQLLQKIENNVIHKYNNQKEFRLMNLGGALE